MIFKDVLIEINDNDLSFKNPIKIFLNHEYEKHIGYCDIYLKENRLYADINFSDEMIKKYNINGNYFPSIGYLIQKNDGKNDGKIFSLGFCINKNKDKRIKSINI